MISVKNLSKIFESGQDVKTTAVDDVSFDIQEGQFIMITGKSGSGKSTLLYQLGLLDHPTSGEIILNGVSTEKLASDERSRLRLNLLGYIFQDYAILPSLTALENVSLPLLMQGMTEEDARKKAIIAMEKIGLGHRLNNLPSQLSGGEQQRVAIARAIAHDPKIVFADEPTANLDTETSDSVLDAFLELNRAGQTIVMVTHEAEYAKLGHRILTLKDGKIVGDRRNK